MNSVRFEISKFSSEASGGKVLGIRPISIYMLISSYLLELLNCRLPIPQLYGSYTIALQPKCVNVSWLGEILV